MTAKTHNAKKLTKVEVTCSKPEPLLDIQIPRKRPVLGMTLLKLSGVYSFGELIKFAKKAPGKNVAAELFELQKSVYACENIDEFLSRFHTRNGELPDGNKTLKAEIKRIRENFDKEFNDTIIHIHSKPKGKGSFTLLGFVYDNVFEILLLDPDHDVAK